MLTEIDLNVLRTMSLFQGLAPDEIASIASHLRRRTLPGAVNLMSVDQPGEAVYIILSGAVKVHVEQRDGTNVILAILGPGETVGEMDMVDSLGRSANVLTIEETQLCWIDRGAFQEHLRTLPTLTYNLARLLSRRLRLSNAQVQALASLDVFGRVARQLLAFAQEYGKLAPDGGHTIPFRLTQSDLADLVGASRVRVNQVFVYFKEKSFISVDPDFRITVRDPDSLIRLYI
jgi:CRP/FNR family transcriptional regulator, cyclic AMP receptor protein